MRNLVIALVCSLALGSVSVGMSSAAQKGGKGNRPQQGQKKKGQAGKGQKGGKGQGRMNPSGIAARMIQEFDKDGDKALNEGELTAALTAMQERRSQRGGGMGKGGAGKGKGGAGKGGAGKGRQGKGGKGGKGPGSSDTGGGVKPKRPGGN